MLPPAGVYLMALSTQQQQQLAQGVGVPQDVGVGQAHDADRHLPVGQHLALQGDVVQEGPQGHRLALQELPGVRPGEGEEVVHQPAHALRLGHDLLHRRRAVLGSQAVEAAQQGGVARAPW